jgi:NAD(P)-dependent dehydrogenase (short-subunit alcohol dehydrogenase family)
MTAKTLDGRIALVTGASRGIGAATAEALAGAGAHVILTARTTQGLEEVEERIHEAGGMATMAPLDLTEADGIGKLAGAIAERWPALDILVINAAMLGTLTPVTAIDPKEFSKLITLNLFAPQALIAAFDPLLRRSDAGRVVAITSSVGRTPRAYWGAYGASKAALETLALSYAEEVARLTPIRVAIVNPGATATVMRTRAFPGEDPTTIKQPRAVGDAIARLVASDYATGHRLEVAS